MENSIENNRIKLVFNGILLWLIINSSVSLFEEVIKSICYNFLISHLINIIFVFIIKYTIVIIGFIYGLKYILSNQEMDGKILKKLIISYSILFLISYIITYNLNSFLDYESSQYRFDYFNFISSNPLLTFSLAIGNLLYYVIIVIIFYKKYKTTFANNI